jgi:hypothetical protein
VTVCRVPDGARRLFNRAIGNFAGVNCPACPNPVKPCLKKAGLCGDKQYEIKATVRDGILCMTMKTEYRAGVTIGALIAASLALSGCMGPTYGTDKTSTAQLIDDLGNIVTIGSPRKGADIEYKPRPAIVKPTETAGLPAPQQNVTENNPAWVESPEETRARLLAEADANSGNSAFRSPLAKPETEKRPRVLGSPRAAEAAPPVTGAAQRQAFQQARRVQSGAYSDRRRFLSDPPLAYRQPAATAPVGELGESEREKEKRWKEEAAKEGTGRRSWWPW